MSKPRLRFRPPARGRHTGGLAAQVPLWFGSNSCEHHGLTQLPSPQYPTLFRASSHRDRSVKAALHSAEEYRLAALRHYGILDTPREADFDEVVEVASAICGTPISVINLIDQGRQWFKAEVGLGVRETPIDSSICAHAILQPGLFVIPDTTLDPRLQTTRWSRVTRICGFTPVRCWRRRKAFRWVRFASSITNPANSTRPRRRFCG